MMSAFFELSFAIRPLDLKLYRHQAYNTSITKITVMSNSHGN